MKRRIPFWIDDPEQRGEQHRDRDRRPDRPAVILDERQEAEERAEHRDGAVREVDDPGPAVDEDDALCEQRVRRTGAESEDRELNCLGHDSAQAVVNAPLTECRHLMYCVTSTGVLFVTMFLPSNREMYT